MSLQLISVAKMLLFFLTVCIIHSSADELFNIGRFPSKNGSHSVDWIEFSKPTSAVVGHLNICRKFGSEIADAISQDSGQIDETKRSCRCPTENATFGYYDRKWQCMDNTKVRIIGKQGKLDPLRC